MSVSARVHMPSLGGATEWLNFEPLGATELRGNAELPDREKVAYDRLLSRSPSSTPSCRPTHSPSAWPTREANHRHCAQRGADSAMTSVAQATSSAIRPFHVDVPDEHLSEMRRRIDATVW